MNSADFAYGFSQGLHGIPQEKNQSHDRTRGWLHGQQLADLLLKEGIPVSNAVSKNAILPVLVALSQLADEMKAMREQIASLYQLLRNIEGDDEPEQGLSLDGRSIPGERDQRESL